MLLANTGYSQMTDTLTEKYGYHMDGPVINSVG